MMYFAYGSNLWRQQMHERCPDMKEVGTGRLGGWRWIITTRGYASITKSETEFVLGTVYNLSGSDERSLDHFEGVKSGDYTKEIVVVDVGGQKLDCMVYIDPVTAEGMPKYEYIDRINNGIRDAGFPEEYVSRYLRPFVPEK